MRDPLHHVHRISPAHTERDSLFRIAMQVSVESDAHKVTWACFAGQRRAPRAAEPAGRRGPEV